MDCSPEAPLSIGFPRQEYWSGWPFPSLRTFLTQGTETWVSCLTGGFFRTSFLSTATLGIRVSTFEFWWNTVQSIPWARKCAQVSSVYQVGVLKMLWDWGEGNSLQTFQGLNISAVLNKMKWGWPRWDLWMTQFKTVKNHWNCDQSSRHLSDNLQDLRTGRFFFYFFFYYCSGFCHTWKWISHGLHVFPIPIPPPTSLSTRSL